jgi:hypothetical protein
MESFDSEELSSVQVRTESTVVRPFDSLNFLESVGIKLFSDQAEFQFDPRIETPEIDRHAISPVLSLPPVPDDFYERIGAEEDELSLFVWVTDSGLKRSENLARMPMMPWPEGEVALDIARIRSISWAEGTIIGVAIVLSSNRECPPGLAYRGGQWLAQKTFRISRPHASGDSLVKYVTEEHFVEAGLPAQTTFYIDLRDPSDLNEPLTDPPQVQVLFSEKLAAVIAQKPGAHASKAFLAQFHSAVATSIIALGMNALEDDDDIQTGSVLDSFVKLVSKELGLTEKEVMTLARENHGEAIRPRLQAKFQVTQTSISSVRGI